MKYFHVEAKILTDVFFSKVAVKDVFLNTHFRVFKNYIMLTRIRFSCHCANTYSYYNNSSNPVLPTPVSKGTFSGSLLAGRTGKSFAIRHVCSVGLMRIGSGGFGCGFPETGLEKNGIFFPTPNFLLPTASIAGQIREMCVSCQPSVFRPDSENGITGKPLTMLVQASPLASDVDASGAGKGASEDACTSFLCNG